MIDLLCTMYYICKILSFCVVNCLLQSKSHFIGELILESVFFVYIFSLADKQIMKK